MHNVEAFTRELISHLPPVTINDIALLHRPILADELHDSISGFSQIAPLSQVGINYT